jgi:para-aminobenzoate synthetase component 1
MRWSDWFDPQSAGADAVPIDLPEEPIDVAMALAGADHFACLDSSAAGADEVRYSVLAWHPFLVLRSKYDHVHVRAGGTWHRVQGDVLAVLDDALRAARTAGASRSDVPYAGGAIGYLGYDLYRFVERYDRLRATDDLELPDCCLAFYDTVLVFDHGRREWLLTGTSVSRGLGSLSEAFKRRAADVRAALAGAAGAAGTAGTTVRGVALGGEQAAQGTSGAATSNMSRREYLSAVERAIEHIFAGDVYQLNLSQRFHTSMDAEPRFLFEALREVNPSAFGAFLPYTSHSVISASPELFLRRTGDVVETRPIKGTRPRGRDEVEDTAQRRSLLCSEKDQAELAMIVDLERNDLGRVCEYGSVVVAEHRRVEELPTVFHTVSTVRGHLREDVGTVDLLRATFPGASVTGCPKIRAIEIIDALEPTRRNAYCGAIGWIGFDGDLALSIAIRTVITKGRDVYFQVGGAIVADSDPDAEYAETLDKAVAVERALERLGRLGRRRA